MYTITLDLDWAPQAVIADTLELLATYDRRATVFCTHEADIGEHEAGLHPNFEGEQPPEKVLDALQALYPQARGVRGHALRIDSRLYQLYRRQGLRYSSSYYLYNQGATPFKTVAGMVEVPIFFEDDLYFLDHGHMNIAPANLALEAEGLKLFNFHPIHIYMNTPSSEHYQGWKAHYQDVEALAERRNREVRGTRDVFIDLLDHLSEAAVETRTLGEIAQPLLGD